MSGVCLSRPDECGSEEEYHGLLCIAGVRSLQLATCNDSLSAPVGTPANADQRLYSFSHSYGFHGCACLFIFLKLNDAAGDLRAGVAGWLGKVIILVSVHHEGVADDGLRAGEGDDAVDALVLR